MFYNCFVAVLIYASVVNAFEAETNTASIFNDRFRKGSDTTEHYLASSFNDSVDTREFNGTRARGARAVTSDISNSVAVGQLDAHRSLDDERALWQKTARYNAYLEADRVHHEMDTGNVVERNDAMLTPGRMKQRAARLEQAHRDLFEHDAATRQQNKTTSEFGSPKERFRAARLDEDRHSHVAITPVSASGYERAVRDEAVDEAAIDSRTRWNILEKERADGQAFEDRLHYNFDDVDIAI